MVTLPCEVCRSVCGDRCCQSRYASFFRFVFCGDCAAISSSRRCVVARMPSSPRSQRATVFDVTRTRAAKPDCERPILCRSRRRSLGVTGVTVYATYSSVKRGRVDRLDESRRRHRAMHAPALAVPVVGGPSQRCRSGASADYVALRLRRGDHEPPFSRPGVPSPPTAQRFEPARLLSVQHVVCTRVGDRKAAHSRGSHGGDSSTMPRRRYESC